MATARALAAVRELHERPPALFQCTRDFACRRGAGSVRLGLRPVAYSAAAYELLVRRSSAYCGVLGPYRTRLAANRHRSGWRAPIAKPATQIPATPTARPSTALPREGAAVGAVCHHRGLPGTE